MRKCKTLEVESHLQRNILSGELETQSSHQEKTQRSVFSRWAGVDGGRLAVMLSHVEPQIFDRDR